MTNVITRPDTDPAADVARAGGFVDADNHYYEAEDAFTRHLPSEWAKQKPFRWVTDDDGRRKLLVAGRMLRRISNPDFGEVAKPGYLQEVYKNDGVLDYSRTGESNEPVRLEYRDRDARLATMDERGVQRIWLFPTLAVNIEQMIRDDVPLTVAAMRAFNRWLDEDWGFAYQDRIYAAPLLSLADPQAAVDELQWVLDRGARLIHLRACPVPGGPKGRSYADPLFGEFWDLANSAGVTVAFHTGDAGMFERASEWGDLADPPTHLTSRFQQVFRDGREIFEAVADFILHGLLEAHPNIRVATIELGAAWCRPLLEGLTKVNRRKDMWRSSEDPVEVFRRHIFVSPYPEEDLNEVVDLLSSDRVLFGSDWPHPEGVDMPVEFFEGADLDPSDYRKIARDNALELLRAE